MEIESTAFTIADLNAFLDEMQDHDRHLLADRLESASRRLGEIGARVNAGRGDGKEWSDHELLAHIATLSSFFDGTKLLAGCCVRPFSSRNQTAASALKKSLINCKTLGSA